MVGTTPRSRRRRMQRTEGQVVAVTARGSEMART